jgi:hypothetical protein
MPHSPYTTLGMAASSSIIFFNIISILYGRKSWVMNIAMVIPKNPPRRRARNELYSVPQIWGRRPYIFWLEFQVEVNKNLIPRSGKAGNASPPIL